MTVHIRPEYGRELRKYIGSTPGGYGLSREQSHVYNGILDDLGVEGLKTLYVEGQISAEELDSHMGFLMWRDDVA